MQKINRGKQFEGQISKAFEAVPNCSIDRIHDQMSGYAGSSNICDFIVYKYPCEFYIECKCCYGNTLNFHNITDNQWTGLQAKSALKGVKAGILVWFIDKDITMFVPIQDLVSLKNFGAKSLKSTDRTPNTILIDGKKKRLFFNYDMTKLLLSCEEI